MKINMNINGEQLKEIGNIGLRLGKKIVVKGVQAIVLETAANVITTGFEEGLDGIKKLKFEDTVLGKKEKQKKSKRKLFSRKNKDESKVDLDEAIDIDVEDTEIIDNR